MEEVASDHSALRYKARAGLLTELSRQTYDSFWKAIRESVLNSIDAGASLVKVDISRASRDGEVSIVDDGIGMTLSEFTENFMSLGGSTKFGDADRFGRIGIGSLALLQYGQRATVETKSARSTQLVRAEIDHSWDLQMADRLADLDRVAAGSVSEIPYVGEQTDNFTRLTIHGVNASVAALGTDTSQAFALVERLRRSLPLHWSRDALQEALEAIDEGAVAELRRHISDWSANVLVHTAWQHDIKLTRRAFGDLSSGSEAWAGPPRVIDKEIKVRSTSGTRIVRAVGFLLNQQVASPQWSGITARVQNVAVEENTFFDVTSDPGFRKYISGEVWLFGDVDAERLINIDRSSFSRECSDYSAIQRFMERAILEFKGDAVQAPQRAKVKVRRSIEAFRSATETVSRVITHLAETLALDSLPSSEPNRRILGDRDDLSERLPSLGARIEGAPPEGKPYVISIGSDGSDLEVLLSDELMRPVVNVGSKTYQLQYRAGSPAMPPVIFRNRPRSIIINTGVFGSEEEIRPQAIAAQVALEAAYLLAEAESGTSELLYEIMSAALQHA